MLPKDYFNEDEDEDNTQDSKPAAAKVARVSLDSKSTKAKKVTTILTYFDKQVARVSLDGPSISSTSNDENELNGE